ncbi:TIGR03067 domain-containing protein [Rhodopirellula sp. MGV]|uniref:TIGR03067 domain-containing protein n=1 Tax=Rhodopirellula sp. MGV TaxID=2023130 RepID=UPI000B95C9E4|nr:TIGR03067 domain-containing protein [Rhodopirellula sp. MGV]OYP33045.1 TIGR03067 domain-containing protein [Rhodopirellula sp. MGV]OYP39235.1 TIGR03067 domain-containing protein [Rhodopirellula sp. MGV]PNY35582.1 TIGR03067 domain-containing protein [Rhodopirellula baltica]
MKSLMFALVVLAVSPRAMADESPTKNAKSKDIEQSLEHFAGSWEIVDVQPLGSTKNAKRLVFRRDRTYAALDANAQELWAGTFDLDPTTEPKIWDHRSNESKATGGDALGIYKLEGDKLKVCCVVGVWKDKEWTGKPRPKEFKLPEADVVLELRRVKTGE